MGETEECTFMAEPVLDMDIGMDMAMVDMEMPPTGGFCSMIGS